MNSLNAKLDLLENVGFLKLRMQRSVKLIARERLSKNYNSILTGMLEITSALESDIQASIDKSRGDQS